MMARTILIAAVLTGVAIGAYRIFLAPSTVPSGTALAIVTVPDLSGPAVEGENLFNRSCASCHGQNAAGLEGIAPPLVHKIYEPGHHADTSFHLAARQGVRAHHWPFGDMPAVEGITGPEIDRIIAYIRELQRANGIF